MVENMGDDLWVGVKCQTNPEIAGSPRNALRCSVRVFSIGGVEPLNGLEGAYKLTDPNQTPNADALEPGSETTRDELRGRKGNSPDRRLRPLIWC